MVEYAKAILHESDILTNEFPFRMIVNENKRFVWPLHWHNAVEIIYIKKDNFEVTVNNREYRLNERDIVCIPSGRLHGFNSDSITGARVFVNFDLSALNAYVGINRITSVLRDTLFIRAQEDPQFHRAVERKFLRMCEDNEKQGATRQLALLARVLDFLSVLYRGFSDRMIQAAEENENSIKGLELINRAFSYIEENYMEEIPLEDIARAVGFSECYFSRIFKKITGKNFRQYLTEVRLKKAESLLMDRNVTVACVAYAAGFNSLATFERIFRQANGCTPTEYRRLNNNPNERPCARA